MRFKKLEGLDYKRGAIEYADKLAPSDRHHLLTKPFYNLAHKHVERWRGEGLDADTHRYFGDFANMAMALALAPGARILDVGCGSGWLAEYFARFGYDVTGIDISPALIDLANERLRNVPFEPSLKYRFLVCDIERAPLTETFDAVICYDALHHFEDEHAVLQNIAAMLDYGGQLFVAEGERPPEDSAAAEELRHVMQQYQTLESPFTRDYLTSLLREHGFAVVGDYVNSPGLHDREGFDFDQSVAEDGAFNYLLCKKVSASGPATMPDSRSPNHLRGSIVLNGELSKVLAPGQRIECAIEVTNSGDTIWLVGRAAPKGTVRPGIKILDETGNVVDEFHGEPSLPHAMAPGEKANLVVSRRGPEQPGFYTLKIDLLDQGICWFEESGSQPLVLPFQVKS